MLGVLLAVATGLVGVLVLLLMILMSRLAIGIESKNKHGVSEQDCSRMGGFAVWASFFLYVFLYNLGWLGDVYRPFYFHQHIPAIFISLLIAVIGFFEDINLTIRPLRRLFFMLVVALIYFGINDSLLPEALDVFAANSLINEPTVLFVGSVLLFVGFVNAGNFIDGANGLLALTIGAVFLFALIVSGEVIFSAIFLGLITFAAYNMLTGKVILGDFGAYSISSFCVLTCFYLYNNFEISIWFFGCLLSYPCFELIRIILVRLVNGSSPLQSDELHFHNYLYSFLQNLGLSPHSANTLTGLLIAIVFSYVPLFLCLGEIIGLDSVVWLYLMAGYGLGLVVLARLISPRKFKNPG